MLKRKIESLLLKMFNKKHISKNMLVSLMRDNASLIVCDASDDDLVFLLNKSDRVISSYIACTGKTWAYDEMEFMLKYIRNENSSGFFFDIGANVGTTSIYMQKKLGQGVQIYAFEPIQQNYTFLKANCVLNNADRVIAENIGLSDNDYSATMKIDPHNMASSRVDKNVLNEYEKYYISREEVQFTSLDKFVQEKGIPIESIKGIWIDVEGSEPSVYRGGKNVFENSNAPVYMEYNPQVYEVNGEYKYLLDFLIDLYDRFICWEHYKSGNTETRDIKELLNLKDEMNDVYCNILLLKT